MQIDETDEQRENADSPIDESRDPDSNVDPGSKMMFERRLHSQKHPTPSRSIVFPI
jgi:hypothetical protein